MAKKAHVASKARAGKPRGLARFAEEARRLGAAEAKVISSKSIVTGNWVRWKCRFGCGGYESSLVCPPNTPTPEETRAMLDEYSAAILFMTPSGDTKSIAVALERIVFLAGHYKALGLGAGPCELCKQCAFDEGCRHPDQARPSMEACGIDVFATARGNGFPIEVVRDYSQPQHYYGVVMVE
jgi:predicted metal-binding protein